MVWPWSGLADQHTICMDFLSFPSPLKTLTYFPHSRLDGYQREAIPFLKTTKARAGIEEHLTTRNLALATCYLALGAAWTLDHQPCTQMICCRLMSEVTNCNPNDQKEGEKYPDC